MSDAKARLIEETVKRIEALRKVATETGCITRRSQSYILSALPDDVLAEVAVRIYPNQPIQNRTTNDTLCNK
jgi:hypothetical protein